MDLDHSGWGWRCVRLNWFRPDLFSLAIVYVHPLVALWFLDRHLQSDTAGVVACLQALSLLLPFVLVRDDLAVVANRSLTDSNGLFWRITQHSGAELLPQVSSHLLVSVHLFLEMLHYGCLDRGVAADRSGQCKFWDVKTVPIARHPKAFPTRRPCFGACHGAARFLWLSFSIDYSTTRDVYFTIAIAHVLAEAPFLLRMI